MKIIALLLLSCLPMWAVEKSLADGFDASVTLDPDVCAEVWQQVQQGSRSGVTGAAFAPSAAGVNWKRWQAVQQAAGTPLMPVLLLAWLQELNPLHAMAEHPHLYAAALGICEQAFAGNVAAREQLAVALRCGAFENGLLMYSSEAAAQNMAESGGGVLSE